MLNILTSLGTESLFIKLLILIFAILVLSFLINFLLSHSILGMSYRIFVAPGVIIHELSHGFLCLLTGARITKMSFFEKTGGHVEHHPSKIPVIGSVLISLAPFFVGSAVIYFLSRKIGLTGVNSLDLNVIQESLVQFGKHFFSILDIHSPKNWLIVYLVLSIAVTMTPSAQDLRNTFSSVIIIGLIVFLISRYTKFSFMTISIPSEAFMLLTTVLLLLIFSLILSIVFFVISMFIKPV